MRIGLISSICLFLTACATTGPRPLEIIPHFPESAHETASAPNGLGGVWWLTRVSPDFSTAQIYEVSGDMAHPTRFSNGGYDAAPGHWRDGVLFTSTREGGWNLWFSHPDGQLSVLPYPVNSDASECCSVPLTDGHFLFSSDRSGDWSIYEATITQDGYDVRPLAGDVNSAHGEWPSYVSPDGRLLLFSSIRSEGIGGDDIYVSQRTPDGWAPPCLLPSPVNQAGYEDGASIVGTRLIWSSRTREGQSGHTTSRVFSLSAQIALSACGVSP
jgi:WD40-like Beta Propeller Repeat